MMMVRMMMSRQMRVTGDQRPRMVMMMRMMRMSRRSRERRGVMAHARRRRRRGSRRSSRGGEAVGAGAGVRPRAMRLRQCVEMRSSSVMMRVEGKSMMRKGRGR